jgi:hypothetical protein
MFKPYDGLPPHICNMDICLLATTQIFFGAELKLMLRRVASTFIIKTWILFRYFIDYVPCTIFLFTLFLSLCKLSKAAYYNDDIF